MTIYTIYAFKSDATIQTVRIIPTITVAKARALLKSGWQVHITDSEGRRYEPDRFDKVLSFDRRPTIKF